MRRAIIIIIVAVILACQSIGREEGTNPSARHLLTKVQERIDKLDALSYQHRIETKLASRAYRFERSARAYLEFDDRIALGARFQFENDAERYVYNGSESFYCTHADKTIRTSRAPSPQHLGHMFLVNGLPAIRKVLAALPSVRQSSRWPSGRRPRGGPCPPSKAGTKSACPTTRGSSC